MTGQWHPERVNESRTFAFHAARLGDHWPGCRSGCPRALSLGAPLPSTVVQQPIFAWHAGGAGGRPLFRCHASPPPLHPRVIGSVRMSASVLAVPCRDATTLHRPQTSWSLTDTTIMHDNAEQTDRSRRGAQSCRQPLVPPESAAGILLADLEFACPGPAAEKHAMGQPQLLGFFSAALVYTNSSSLPTQQSACIFRRTTCHTAHLVAL